MKESDRTILNVIIWATTLSLLYIAANFNPHLFELGGIIADTPAPFNEIMFKMTFNQLEVNWHYVDAICFTLGYYIY